MLQTKSFQREKNTLSRIEVNINLTFLLQRITILHEKRKLYKPKHLLEHDMK